MLIGRANIIYCIARGVLSRIPVDFRKPIDKGSMLIVTQFKDSQKRPTKEAAMIRNRFVAETTDDILIPYAHPGSNTEHVCKELIQKGKKLYTIDSEFNSN
ncbi:hypothetical protein ACFL6O_02925 [candidate division KSB1 bacterium]